MKKHINTQLLTATAVLFLFSCKPQIDVPAPQKGELDVSSYVAIGNSMTAGYADNALYRQAQLSSYPNILAGQFQLIGGGQFKQPLVSEASVGIGAEQNARYALAPVTDCMGATSLAPLPIAQSGDLSIFATPVGQEGPYNNMAVPGLKSIAAVYPGYGNPQNGAGEFNPFFTRIAADVSSSSVLSDAAGQQPSFFSLSIGQDDVLGYALSGGTQDLVTPVSGPPGVGFDGSMGAIVSTLTANNAKGVIMNVPALSSLPFFTTVPYNGLMLDEANAAALSAAYAPLGISFHAGANPFMIEDANAPGGMRQIGNSEMILLSVPQDSLKCAGWGSMKPIPDRFVLTTEEISKINDAVEAYNQVLHSLATDNGLAFVDVNAFFSRARTGIMYNGVGMNTQYVIGGVFSLDGINLTPKGNALLANEIIRSLNTKYHATIPEVDANRFSGVLFP